MPGAPPDILKQPGNRTCADCGSRDPRWSSTNIGILICETCAGIHRNLGTHLSRVKSVKLDDWKPEWITVVRAIGNERANAFYEHDVPEGRRYVFGAATQGGDKIDPVEAKLLNAWIRAKYETKDFAPPGVEEPYRRLERGEPLDEPNGRDGGGSHHHHHHGGGGSASREESRHRKRSHSKHRKDKERSPQVHEMQPQYCEGAFAADFHGVPASPMPPPADMAAGMGVAAPFHSASGMPYGQEGFPNGSEAFSPALSPQLSPEQHYQQQLQQHFQPQMQHSPEQQYQQLQQHFQQQPQQHQQQQQYQQQQQQQQQQFPSQPQHSPQQQHQHQQQFHPPFQPQPQQPSPWAVSAEQLERYRAIFEGVDRRDPNFLGPAEARELFERSQLPFEELSHVWNLSDVDNDGQLAFDEFACAMHLVSWRRQGVDLPRELPPELSSSLAGAARAFPPPAGPVPDMSSFYSRSSPQLNGAQPAMVQSQSGPSVGSPARDAPFYSGSSPQLSGAQPAAPPPQPGPYPGAPVSDMARFFSTTSSQVGGAQPAVAHPQLGPSPWSIDAGRLRKYQAIFERIVGSAAGSLGPAEAMDLLARSGLPREELSQIWQLADVDGDGRLAFGEFACAMHCVSNRRHGLEVPPALPPELVAALAGAGAMGGGASVREPSWPAQGWTPEHLASPAFSSPSPSSPSSWAISPELLERYRGIFENSVQQDIATVGMGAVPVGAGATLGPVTARELLDRSGLSPAELQHVWRLSDVDGDNRLTLGEFACAVHLAAWRRQGRELPAFLPAELAGLAGTSAGGPASPLPAAGEYGLARG